jgi:hypothetical protein
VAQTDKERLDQEYNKKITDNTASQFKDPNCFLNAESLASQVQELNAP